jgi:hypothetical protein
MSEMDGLQRGNACEVDGPRESNDDARRRDFSLRTIPKLKSVAEADSQANAI